MAKDSIEGKSHFLGIARYLRLQLDRGRGSSGGMGELRCAFGLRLLHFGRVEEVLRPARCQFVSDEVFCRDDEGRQFPADLGHHAVLPCIFECDSIDSLEYIDTKRRLAHLKDGPGLVVKVVWGESSERSAEGECTKDGAAVFGVGLDPNVEILGGARFGVDAYGIGSDD